jgi:hypothetical protein
MLLFFGSCMAFFAGTTLLWRGTVLDRMWALNAPAYKQLAPFGKTAGIPFLLLSATLVVAGIGWRKRRRWGWWLAVAVIATQVLGDLVSVFMGHAVGGGIGVTIASALLFYLLRPKVRFAFEGRNASSVD